MVRSLEESKHLAYQVFGNVISSIEEFQRKQMKQAFQCDVQHEGSSKRIINDANIMVELNLIIFGMHTRNCNPEIREEVLEELKQETLMWKSKRVCQQFSSVDVYVMELLQMLNGENIVPPQELEKFADISDEELKEAFTIIGKCDNDRKMIEKEFRSDKDKKAVRPSIPGCFCSDDEITWRSYPIDSFPAVSYLHGIMLDFCERLTNAAKTMSLDINAHPRYNKVNIGFVGRPERKLMRLVSKKTGQACDEIEDEDVYNTSLHIPLPFILVCFLKENETISCCVEGKCSIEQQFESLLKSPVRTLIVHQNADLAFSNQQTHLVVSNQKDEVRQGLASLVEETMFGKFEEYEKDIDRDSYSLLQEFSAIRRLQEPMDLAISTDISTKRKVPPEIIQRLSKYDDIVAFGVWNTDFRILTKKSISADQKNDICKQLEETDKSFYTSCKPSFYIIINEEIYCPYAIQQGAKITEHGNSVKKRTSGTLGGIAIGSNQKLYGLTCSHVLPQIDSAVYMSDGLGNSIGQCIFSNASGPKSMCDFAVFEVDGHIVSNCIRSLVDEKNKERKASLCKLDLSSLSGKLVHKKGASTEWTKGIIACAELHERFSCGRTDSKELMVFEGFNKTQFADRGDSGSLVIAHDLRNNRNNLLVLGMVSGGELKLREDNSSANTQNLTSYSLGFYLNHAIDLFKKKFSNIDLHFDNDIKSSSSESDSE